MSKNESVSTDRNLLLREFIEAILEAEGSNDLYNTFIQPFVDVGITAAYGLEKLSAQVQTVIKGFFLGLPTLFVPFLEYDYETFREEEAEKVENIKKKYEKTLQVNLDAIVSNDAFGLAFLLAPATVMGAQLAVKAPMAALKVFDVLTGGLGLFKGIQQAIGGAAGVGFHDPGGHQSGAWASGGPGGTDVYEPTMQEAKQQPDQKALSQELQKALKDKKVLSALQKSPIAKQMRQDAVNIIVGHVQKFMGLQDYNQMRQMAKNDAGFAQIGQELAKLNQSGQVPAQDNPTVTQAMVPELKKAYKNFWIKQMQQLIQKYPEANAELNQGIKQVQALQ